MSKASPDDLLTVKEASLLKGISQNGIRIAIRSGRLAAESRSFGYLIRRSDLLQWKPRKKKSNG